MADKTLQCSSVSLKIILLVINSIYLVLGSIILILGFFFAISDLNVVPTNIHALEDALFVLVGSGIFFIAIIGLLGAGSDSVPALITYCFFAFGLIVVQLVVGFAAASGNYTISDQINGLLHEYIKDYQISNSTDYRSANNEFVNTIQSTVGCCGVNGPMDWSALNPNFFNAYGFPYSCRCNGEDCVTIKNVQVWSNGCNETIYYGNILLGLATSTFVVLLIQVITFVFTVIFLCLLLTIKKRSRTISLRSDNNFPQNDYVPLNPYGSTDK